MASKSIFKTDFAEALGPTDPESLFHTLRERGRDIKHLWAQQADLLRAYHQKHLDASDVAIELPTGAGKTLVGLLIAEWRRRARSERIAYLCPTRQLARQVHEQAKGYGIQTRVLIGKQRDYSPQDYDDFQTNRAIAVTTYSAIFNVNPRINDAQTLILDDAHAGENFIASMWSVEVDRSEATHLYRALLNLLRDAFDASVYEDFISDDKWEPRKASLIELVPSPVARQHAAGIRALLDEHLQDKTPPRYAWNSIKDSLDACNIYISSDGFLIRPFIPPTLVHPAFSRAKQRVYMSATLGVGGELERLSGVRNIKRIPLPRGWDRRGSGRRLFLMPNLALEDDDALRVIKGAVQAFGRGLVLTPSRHDPDGKAVISTLSKGDISLLYATEIEDSIKPFVESENSVLVLSRYDGLDLADDTCRCVVLAGLPNGANLQERFLWSRIAAHSLLRDRVLTRFTQGVGRCTRSDNDYALVMIVGRRLVDFLQKVENRRIFNPELQAEMQFGIENSRNKESDEFADLWGAFSDQGEEWRQAERAIVAQRERLSRHDDPISQRLQSVVADEVTYLYARWRDDLEFALECARKVADGLGGEETKAYRAWWYYLSADSAMALQEATGDDTYRSTARDLLRRASACCLGIRWFARLGRTTSLETNSAPRESETTAAAVEAIRQRLTEWRPVGKHFERKISEVERDLESAEYKAFHRGLKGLGEMLGFEANLPKTDAAPDCVWALDCIYVSHEAKSDQTPSDPLGVNNVRQAASHMDWIKANRPVDQNTKIVCLIESPRTTIASEVVTYAKTLCHVTPAQLKVIFDEITAVLRRVRPKIAVLTEEKLIEELYREIDRENLTPDKVVKRLTTQQVSKMKVVGRSAVRG